MHIILHVAHHPTVDRSHPITACSSRQQQHPACVLHLELPLNGFFAPLHLRAALQQHPCDSLSAFTPRMCLLAQQQHIWRTCCQLLNKL